MIIFLGFMTFLALLLVGDTYEDGGKRLAFSAGFFLILLATTVVVWAMENGHL